MKRSLLLLFIGLSTGFLSAQTTFWTEDFGTGCNQGNLANGTVTGNGTWTLTNVTAPAAEANKWFISSTEAGMGVGVCGDGCISNAALTNRTLHVGSVSTSPSAGIFCPTGDCGAAYDSGGGCGTFGCVSMNDRAESPIINCTGQSAITLNFNYLEGNGDATNDFMEVMYSANGGTTWSSLSTPGSTNNIGCGSGQGKWTAFSVALPPTADNNANVKIGFRWQNNDDGTGNDPSVAIDDVTLSVVTATLVPTVTITPSPNDTICQTATLTLGGSAGNGPILSWAWTASPNAGVVFNPDTANQNPTVTFASAGTYTFTLAVANATDTGSTTQVIVVLPTVTPGVVLSPSILNPVCIGTPVTFTANIINGGTTPVYQWAVNGVSVVNNNPVFGPNVFNNNDVVSFTLTSNAICVSPSTASTSYTLQTVAAPTVTVTHGTATVCPGIADTLIAVASAGSSFSWSPSSGLNMTNNDSVIATNATNGTYTYYVTATKGGCSAIDSVVVNVSNTLIAVAGSPSTICQGQSAPLSVTGGTSWQWIPSSGNIVCNTCQNTTASPTVTTTFSVIASAGACVDTVTETITVIPNASVSFNTTSTAGIPQTVTFSNTSLNSTGFYWTFGDNTSSVLQNPVPHVYNGEGTYTVVLIAYGNNGCNDTLSTLVVIADTIGVSVPNIFTPNGDEINDVWKPSIHGVKSFECVIYDRWGLKVYEFAGAQDHWDGYTTAGLKCQDGTYYYILKTTDNNNKSYDLKGFIQLIR